MHLMQPGFTYTAYGPFTKNKERIQILKETGNLWYIYLKELDKAWFQHGMAYRGFKDLTRITAASDKILCVKHLRLLKIQNMMDIKEVLVQFFVNVLTKNALRL